MKTIRNTHPQLAATLEADNFDNNITRHETIYKALHLVAPNTATHCDNLGLDLEITDNTAYYDESQIGYTLINEDSWCGHEIREHCWFHEGADQLPADALDVTLGLEALLDAPLAEQDTEAA